MGSDLIGILGVVAVVVGGGYIFYVNYAKGKEKLQKAKAREEIVYPLRLQALERMTIFLERIKPKNLLPRMQVEQASPQELQALLINEIKSEFSHNAAQQIYISPKTWEKIETAANTTVGMLLHGIGSAGQGHNSKEIVVSLLQDPGFAEPAVISEALQALKAEVQENF